MPTVVDKSGDRIKRMFAGIAGKYDLMNHMLSCNVDRLWRRTTVKALPPDGKGPILDVCTGTGDLALAYWKASGGETPIIGTDFCPEMLTIARQKQGRLGIQRNLEFKEADAQDLPFSNDTFQLVTVAFGLRNVENTELGLTEMLRVCRPGGRVGILEFSRPGVWPLSALYQAYFRHILPRIGQWIARNDESAYAYLPASVGAFPSGEELASILRAVGFRAVTYRPLTLGIATLYVGTK